MKYIHRLDLFWFIYIYIHNWSQNNCVITDQNQAWCWQHCGDKTISWPFQLYNGFPILLRQYLCIESGPRRKIPYRNSHCGDKTILQQSYLHNGISYTDKTSLHWIRATEKNSQRNPVHCMSYTVGWWQPVGTGSAKGNTLGLSYLDCYTAPAWWQ